MTRVAAFLKRVHHEESGQDLIEYALLAALIALGAVLGMGAVASGINSAFSAIARHLTSAVS